jgi:hypothetical protein
MPVDLSSPAHYALVLLPEIVLSAWAMFVLLLDVFQKGSRSEPSSPLHAVAHAGRPRARGGRQRLDRGLHETGPAGA